MNILGTRVSPTSYKKVANQVVEWAQKAESRAICIANVHVLMEAYDSREFAKEMDTADLVTRMACPWYGCFVLKELKVKPVFMGQRSCCM